VPKPPIPKPQIVSWLIDGVLAGSLLWAVYSGGQFVEKLEGAINDMGELTVRVSSLETNQITPEASRRISMLEVQTQAHEKAYEQFRVDLTTRLSRFEDKLDRALK